MTDPKQFLQEEENTGETLVVAKLKEASRFPTEAAAIVTLEDSDYMGDFYPDYVRA
jgi:hypothetical protein